MKSAITTLIALLGSVGLATASPFAVNVRTTNAYVFTFIIPQLSEFIGEAVEITLFRSNDLSDWQKIALVGQPDANGVTYETKSIGETHLIYRVVIPDVGNRNFYHLEATTFELDD